MTTTVEQLTLVAYAALDEPEHEYVTELVRGSVVREPRPGSLHARIQFQLAHRLILWTERTGMGVVYGESGFILSEDPATVRGPDIAVVTREHDSAHEPGGWIRGSPEVAVEVASPSDTSSSLQQKVLEYLNAGSSLVWIVDPTHETVTVYRPDGSASLLRSNQTLSGEDVLPGFDLELAALFD